MEDLVLRTFGVFYTFDLPMIGLVGMMFDFSRILEGKYLDKGFGLAAFDSTLPGMLSFLGL